MVMETTKHNPPVEKVHSTPKAPTAVYGSASSDRPYACPYEGCGKSYIHEYKLNLHLRREHPGHNPEENGKHAPDIDNDMDEGSDQDAYVAKGSSNKSSKRAKPKPVPKMPPTKITQRKGSSMTPVNSNVRTKQWTTKEVYEEDSEETEDRDNGEEDRWQYTGEANDDDEETEYED